MDETIGETRAALRRWGPAGLYVVTERGEVLVVRPLVRGDEPALEAFLGGLSPQTLYLRYFTPMPSLSNARAAAEIARLMGGGDRITLVGRRLDDREIVVVVEVAFDRERPGTAEVALVVADSHQGQGIGSSVAAALARLPPSAEVRGVRATALAQNRAVARLFAAVGPYRARRDGETTEYWAEIR
jgi:acetate---CoA ligase (ADP-forming)